MGREANNHSIRALEKQIEEGKGDIIQLKRTRNSLLNISTLVPPEILGDVFAWSLVREAGSSLGFESDFDGLQRGSYSFLLVCHHWFEVASRTPELWSFWGNTLQNWKNQHHRSGDAPLDLVLDGSRCDPDVSFNESLRGAVRGHVMQDAIRQVHLTSDKGATLTPIISSLTPDDGARNENIESIVWRNRGHPSVDVSDFFAQSRLLKLRQLKLHGDFRISWDRLASQTMRLTTLLLKITDFPSTSPITTSQLFSILASNPNLQKLSLSDLALPIDTDGSTPPVPLRDLEALFLTGNFRHVFGLLRQLILPDMLDHLYLTGLDSAVEDLLQILGPYMRDRFRRDPRFQDKLEITFFSTPDCISVSVDAMWPHATVMERDPPFAVFVMEFNHVPPPDVLEQLFIGLTIFLPHEYAVSFSADLHVKPPEELFSMMPNVETLDLSGLELSKGFLQPNPDGPRANTKLLPSLRSLCLHDITLDGDDWSHLTTYLAHQTSDGRAILLEIGGCCPHMCPDVVEEVEALVEDFDCYPGPATACPFGRCEGG